MATEGIRAWTSSVAYAVVCNPLALIDPAYRDAREPAVHIEIVEAPILV
jgi:hypothetical protein